jgi:hypothetical protein
MLRPLRLAAVACVAALRASTPAAASDSDPRAGGGPAVCTAEDRRLPYSVHVPEALAPHVETLLAHSETFRRQCRRIAAASSVVHVRIRIDPLIAHRSYRARSLIQRHRSGVITAIVELSLSDGVEEWIAHEFEHIIEQIEGIRVVDLAFRGRVAWRSVDQAYETARAIRAGHAALREVRAFRQSDIYVEGTRRDDNSVDAVDRASARPGGADRTDAASCLRGDLEPALLRAGQPHGVAHRRGVDGAGRGSCRRSPEAVDAAGSQSGAVLDD